MSRMRIDKNLQPWAHARPIAEPFVKECYNATLARLSQECCRGLSVESRENPQIVV